jgi:hypothetical protein
MQAAQIFCILFSAEDFSNFSNLSSADFDDDAFSRK